MPSFVYLVRNDDLFKIGRTDNLVNRIQSLRPGVLVAALQTDLSRDIEHALHKKYKHRRLPQSEYFRLTKVELADITKVLKLSDEQAFHFAKYDRQIPKSNDRWRRSVRKRLTEIVTQPDFDPKGIPDIIRIREQMKEEFPEYFPPGCDEVLKQPQWRDALRSHAAWCINQPGFDPEKIPCIDLLKDELIKEYPEYFASTLYNTSH